MVEEPSHVKQLSLNHVCKIGSSIEEGYKGKNSGPFRLKVHQFLPVFIRLNNAAERKSI
jgi:hypothetical protein